MQTLRSTGQAGGINFVRHPVQSPPPPFRMYCLPGAVDHRASSRPILSRDGRGRLAPPGVSAQATGFPTAEFLHRARLLAADLKTAGVNTQPHEQALAAIAAELKALPADADAPAAEGTLSQDPLGHAAAGLQQPVPGLSGDRLLQAVHAGNLSRRVPEPHAVGLAARRRYLRGHAGRAEGEPQVRPLLHGALGPGHVHGMDLWWDATRVVFGYAQVEERRAGPGFPRPLGTSAPARQRADPYLRDRHRRPEPPAVDRPRLWSDLDPTYLPNGEIALRFGALRVLAPVQRDGQGRDLLQPLRDAARRQPHPPPERHQGRRLPAPLPRRRHDRLHPLGIRAAGLGQHPVALDRAARRHRGRRLVQAAPERSLGAGGLPLDPRHDRQQARGHRRRPPHPGRRPRGGHHPQRRA